MVPETVWRTWVSIETPRHQVVEVFCREIKEDDGIFRLSFPYRPEIASLQRGFMYHHHLAFKKNQLYKAKVSQGKIDFSPSTLTKDQYDLDWKHEDCLAFIQQSNSAVPISLVESNPENQAIAINKKGIGIASKDLEGTEISLLCPTEFAESISETTEKIITVRVHIVGKNGTVIIYEAFDGVIQPSEGSGLSIKPSSIQPVSEICLN